LDSVFSREKTELTVSWYLDETYIKVNGKWHYYYRMIDRNNSTVAYMLSKNRDKKAAKRFLKKSMVGNEIPFMITTDKSGSNLSALHRYNVRNKEKQIYIRDVKYKNNRIEQDHRFIKKRTNPMLGFKSMRSADNTNCISNCIINICLFKAIKLISQIEF
jgi:putative transposase